MKIRMLTNHREFVVRREYEVPSEINAFRASALISNGIAEWVEMAVKPETERAVSVRGKRGARRKQRTNK